MYSDADRSNPSELLQLGLAPMQVVNGALYAVPGTLHLIPACSDSRISDDKPTNGARHGAHHLGRSSGNGPSPALEPTHRHRQPDRADEPPPENIDRCIEASAWTSVTERNRQAYSGGDE